MKNVNKKAINSLITQLDGFWDDPDTYFFDCIANTVQEGQLEAITEALVALHMKRGRNVVARTLQLSSDHNQYPLLVNLMLPICAQLSDTAADFLEILEHFNNQSNEAIFDSGNSIALFCKTKRKEADQFIGICLKDPDSFEEYLIPALSARSSNALKKMHSLVMRMCSNKDLRIRHVGITMLGFLNYSGHLDLVDKAVTQFEIVFPTINDESAHIFCRAIGNLQTEYPREKLEKMLYKLADHDSKLVQIRLCEALLQCVPHCKLQWYIDTATIIAASQIKDKQVIESFDYLLSKILSHSPNLAKEMLEKWAGSTSFSNLGIPFKALSIELTKTPRILESYITDWFFSHLREMHYLAAGFLEAYSLYSLSLNESICKISFNTKIVDQKSLAEISYMTRKVVGHLYFSSGLIIPLIFSLLRTSRRKKSIETITCNLFVEILCIGYPGASEGYLKSVAKNGNAREKRIAAVIQKAFHPYIKKLEQLPELKELTPRFQHLEKLRIADSRKNYKTIQETKNQQRGTLLDLIPTVNVKHTRMFELNEDGISLPTSKATPLTLTSVSYELPSWVIYDPIGCDFHLQMFRTETLEELTSS